MEMQTVKFYQTGTFTVGNRLLAENERSVQANMQRTNSLNSGHRACQGCGEALGARYAIDAAMRVANGKLIAVNATGCLEVFSTPYPETSWQIPWIHSLFGNAAAVASGVAAAMRRKGTTDVARAYLEYLYSKEGQEIIAKHYYRPRDPEVAARYASLFPKVNLVTIADFGGWAAAQKKHFADGAIFDEATRR